MVQWLNVQDPSAGDPGWITGQATRSCRMQLKILYAATKTQRSKTKKNIFKTLFSIVEYWLFYCNHIMHSCNSDRFYFPGFQNHNGDYSHEIKRHLLLGRKAMTKLNSILKSRDITLLTKVRLVKAMVFPVVMYGCESWTIKKAEHQRTDAFELWCWRGLLRVPWTARSNQSILKEINPEYSLEGLMLKLKPQYFGLLM